MGLKREYAVAMENAGFTKKERKAFADAHKKDGSAMDTDRIFHSIPFQKMLQARRTWWEHVLSPKANGGKGWTIKEGERALDAYMDKKSKSHEGFWSFLKAEYRPPSRIKSESAFKAAISSKASITHSLLGRYSTHIKGNPVRSNRCLACRGTGTVVNLEHRQTTCLRCGGSGKSDNRKS
jgi:DnaJ-class molecular chaperone